MPLDILIRTYRLLWDQATAGSVPDLALAKEASAIAEKAAPYLHPRLSAVASLAGGKTLRDLVLESMGGKDQLKVIEHAPQPSLPARIDAPENEPSQTRAPPVPDRGDVPARGSSPPADWQMDDAARFEELRRHVREQHRAEPQPRMGGQYLGNTRPYGSPERCSPRSAEAEDVEFHVRRIRRGMGLPD